MVGKLSGVKINLRKRQTRVTSAEFFAWLTQIGRVIVVVTELIALSALLYRFVIDMQIIDLHEEIKREKDFLKLRAKEEEQYRQLQEKLFSIDVIPQQSYDLVRVYYDVAKKTQEFGLVDVRFGVDKSSLAIEGKSVSVFSFKQYIDYLKDIDQVFAINLNEVTQQQGGVRFSIGLELKAEDNLQ